LEADSPGERDTQYILAGSLTLMGDLLLAEGQREKAAEQYREALSLLDGLAHRYPDHGDEVNILAWTLVICADPRIRDPARALPLAQRIVERFPENGNYWSTLGAAQYRLGQWQAALVSMEKANQLFQETDEGTWWFLAMIHWQLGDKEAARTCYDRADKLAKGFEYPRAEESRFHAEAAQLHIKGDSP
jgi:tetratricopeptide (TPR) repeat protein